MENELAAIVIDCGSGKCKAGFAGMSLISNAQSQRDILTLNYPVKRGIITNWDDMENIWLHILHSELHTTPEEHPILIADTPLNPDSNRERTAQIMFETFNVPALAMSIESVLSLYATSARTSGVVLESGDGVTSTVPIFEGYPLRHGILRWEFGGNDLTEHLLKSLGDRGSYVHGDVLTDIKEQSCHVALDFDQEQIAPEKTHELPDGKAIILGSERFRVPEALFKPHLVGEDTPGVHEMIHNSIMKCDVDVHRQLYSRISLSGGTTMLSEFADRMAKEVEALAPVGMRFRIAAPDYRKHAVWIGGSILASLSTFRGFACSRQEYDEMGPIVVNRKQWH
ncbi:actin alpha 1 skeletal muscle protein [Coprinopsis cinerea okayama7|uniref:Actin alpha 1 skeletal muscle protein n=1 Tax=Coprinopsis cinerea (strain Okayama-7 / 130 / ATCC MYA-4618 / FGSC 9003) TaxID=240176 RepID=A8PB10_COPC7|nr:actin alpha 1 skeletal muscle protein [Coprinopsis cinerea okayama7\|eukprot:XP_001840085.2 actin alpha 1 skeletal muscle protein [Coprinopsis cinerea okayama7\